MLRKLIHAGAIVAVFAGSAAAQDIQDKPGISLNPRRQLSPEQIEKQKATDQAYRAAMKKFPIRLRPGIRGAVFARPGQQPPRISSNNGSRRPSCSLPVHARPVLQERPREPAFKVSLCGRGEMVDARDLKSLGRKAVRVRVPPSAPVSAVSGRGTPITHAKSKCGFGS